MPALAPLKLTLYDLETFEARGDYICNSVPLRYLKLAIRLSKSLININDDVLTGLIVDLFNRQFSADELVKYSEQSDRILVLQAIMLRAGSFTSKHSDNQEAGADIADGTQYDLEDEDWIIDLEISLVKAFNWSLKDIDETDIESLMPFVARFAVPKINQTEKKKIFCDEISWL